MCSENERKELDDTRERRQDGESGIDDARLQDHHCEPRTSA